MMLSIDKIQTCLNDILWLTTTLIIVLLIIKLNNPIIKLGMILLSILNIVMVWTKFNAEWLSAMTLILYSVIILSFSCFGVITSNLQNLVAQSRDSNHLFARFSFKICIVTMVLGSILGYLVKDYNFITNVDKAFFQPYALIKLLTQEYNIILICMGVLSLNAIILIISLHHKLALFKVEKPNLDLAYIRLLNKI